MQFFLVLAVIVCVAAGLLIRRNRERARNAPLPGTWNALAATGAALTQ